MADYLGMLDAAGLRYGVLVQTSVYRTENRCIFDALGIAPDRLRGVVDLDVVSATDAELEWMTGIGVCGLRLRWPTASSPDQLREVAAPSGRPPDNDHRQPLEQATRVSRRVS